MPPRTHSLREEQGFELFLEVFGKRGEEFGKLQKVFGKLQGVFG